MKSLLLLALVLQLAHLPVEKPKKLPPSVTIKVTPEVGIAPLTVRVVVKVQRDGRNRTLRIAMLGPLDGESGTQEIDGTSAVYYERLFEVRGGGPIEFTALVTRNDGTRPVASRIYCYPGRSEMATCEADEP